MGDLIDRFKLPTVEIEINKRLDDYTCQLLETVVRAIRYTIDSAPAVDAVEVVRCIDCVHSAVDAYSNRRMCIRNGEIRPNGRIWFGTAVNDDHFCGYGASAQEVTPDE